MNATAESRAENCLFCKIAAGEIQSKKVLETADVLAFWDINPAAPIHVLVIPKWHYSNAADLAQNPELLAKVVQATNDVMKTEQVQEILGGSSDYQLLFNTGEDAGQTVFHVHAHVLAGISGGALKFSSIQSGSSKEV
jgi:histidine triad (HIT) family protein